MKQTPVVTLFGRQLVNLKVNEKGSEAAAATAVVMGRMCAMMPTTEPPKFVADHPFLFTITDGKSLLFFGRFMG